ncbi:hypothetical protein [Microbacterium schleiferi]|uniref:PucR family transcriptional regulator n=1 Tax=Microbacterium schleiferi TaxID=69362 RepID=A0ABU7V877_9MICO
MQELVGRITALDPEASETLKVITYFDALVGAGAGIDALLRAAATLSGVTAGLEHRDRIRRRDASGRQVDGDPVVTSPARDVPGGRVWLERGDIHVVADEMVVERFALAVTVTLARHEPDAALEIVIDRDRPRADRVSALARLRLDASSRVRIAALPPDHDELGSGLLAGHAGVLRGLLLDSTREAPARGGISPWVRADLLPEGWEAATLALRLTGPAHPVVDAGELGSLLLAVGAFDPSAPPEDVTTLAGLDPRSRDVLGALVNTDSLRGASAALGMHHSTVQARHEALTRDLGYDPRSPLGRARYFTAELLLRLVAP